MGSYTHLSSAERDQIRIWRAAGRDLPGSGSGEIDDLAGVVSERTAPGSVFSASRRRSLSTAQAA